MKVKRYKIIELKNMRESFSENKINLERKLSKIDSIINNLNDILKGINSIDDKVEILLPAQMIDYDFKIEDQPTVKWNKEINEILYLSTYFLSLANIYDKLLQKHSALLVNKRNSLKTISATLIALQRNGKIGKLKDKSGQFIYGHTSKHFMDNGKANPLYIDKRKATLTEVAF